MAVLLGSNHASGEYEILKGMLASLNPDALLKGEQGMGGAGAVYVTGEEPLECAIGVVTENKKFGQALLSGYVYGPLEDHLVNRLSLRPNSVYELTISKAPADAKIFFSQGFSTKNLATMSSFTDHTINVPVIENGQNKVITHIDYSTTSTITIDTSRFDQDVDLSSICMWVKLPTFQLIGGDSNELKHSLKTISIPGLNNLTFVGIRVDRDWVFNTSSYSGSVSVSSIPADGITKTTLSNGVESTVEVSTVGNVTTKTETYSDGSRHVVITYTRDGTNYAKTYTTSKIASTSTINRPLTAECSNTFDYLYISDYFDAPSLSDSGAEAFIIDKMNKSRSGYIFDNQDGTYFYDFSLREVSNSKKSYLIWGLSNSPDGWLADPPNGDNEYKSCLTGDTLISLYNGGYKRLDEVQVGDVVLSEEGKMGSVIGLRRGVFIPKHTKFFFEKEIVIDKVEKHCFYNVEQGFYQELDRWNIGDHAIMPDGTTVALLSKQDIEEEVESFAIWTDTGNCYANDLLSSCTHYNKKYLKDAPVEQIVDMAMNFENDVLRQFLDQEGIGL